MKFSGKKLRETREEAGLSLRELARTIGRHFQTLDSWELGDSTPNTNDLPKIATALDKPLSFFYADDSDSHQNPAQQPSAVAGATNGGSNES